MPYTLLRLTPDQLLDLSAARAPAEFADRADPEALPPPRVADRALRLLADGGQDEWCCTFVIVRLADQRIVGGCGYKGPPRDGQVEIGYGVSPECRRQGAASVATALLLQRAWAAGVPSVRAEILPDNAASAGVVRKLGFSCTERRVADDGETVDVWVATRPGEVA